MLKTTSAFLLISLLLFAACQRSENAMAPPEKSAGNYATAPADEAAPQTAKPAAPPAGSLNEFHAAFFTSSVSVVGKMDSLKQFIRTADLRFRVTDALKATLAVEDIAARNGGFVTNNDLSSSLDNRETTPVSADSMLEITHFTLVNRVTLRVPAAKLDTTIRAIGRLVDFLDYRRLHAKDVELDLLEQDLTRNREQEFQNEAKAGDATKAADRLNIAESRRDSRANADRARVERMRTEDAIRYSTVELDIYQRPQVQYRMLPREKPVAAFRPGFGAQIWDALVDGWQVLRAIFLGLIRMWSVLLLLGVVIVLLRRYWKKKS